MKTLSDNVLNGLTRNVLIKTIKELYAMREEVINYLKERSKLNNKILSEQHDEAQHIECEAENILIDELLDILQGNKEEL